MLRLAVALLCLCAVPLAASTVITGKLTGTGGKPVEKAHVHIAENMFEPPLKSVEVGKDGSYRIEADDSSPYLLLQFTGASHKMEAVPLLVEKKETVELNVQLQPNSYSSSIEGVTVVGDFNDFDFNTGVAMQRQPDGTYTADFTSDKSEFTYQVIVADGNAALRSVNGTMYDRLVYDGGGDYRSVIAVNNGAVKLVFDPKKFPSSATPPLVQFGPESKHCEKFSLGAKETEAKKSVIIMMAQTARAQGDAQAPGKELKRALEELAGRIEKEHDASTRNYLLLFYLELAGMTELSREKPDPVIERAFREIAPESVLWAYNPNLHYMMSYAADGEKVKEYRAAMLDASVSPKVRCAVLSASMSSAFYDGREAEGERYYRMLVDEFPGSHEADYARKQFDPDRAIKKGKRVPAFSVASLEKGDVQYSNESLKGKYYLIDFWATWCGPCVKEMENLHTAYEQFRESNFEILSLSFDGKPDDVAKFRSKKWTMPWLHTFVEGGFKSDLGKAFEVAGIPKPILVDPNGVIVATDADLRGEKLQQTLAKFLKPVATGNR